MWHKNSIIYKIIENLCICQDTRCEKYCRWIDTNGEMVWFLISPECHSHTNLYNLYKWNTNLFQFMSIYVVLILHRLCQSVWIGSGPRKNCFSFSSHFSVGEIWFDLGHGLSASPHLSKAWNHELLARHSPVKCIDTL